MADSDPLRSPKAARGAVVWAALVGLACLSAVSALVLASRLLG